MHSARTQAAESALLRSASPLSRYVSDRSMIDSTCCWAVIGICCHSATHRKSSAVSAETQVAPSFHMPVHARTQKQTHAHCTKYCAPTPLAGERALGAVREAAAYLLPLFDRPQVRRDSLVVSARVPVPAHMCYNPTCTC
jgi:hypothetical protein